MRSTCLLILLAAALAAADYPTWRGDGSGAMPDSGLALVDSWDDARFLWKSEEEVPVPFRTCIGRGWPARAHGNGGHANPVIAGGRLYLTIWKPSGEKVGRREKTGRSNPRPNSHEASLIDADDVVLCIDAATGRNLWRTVFESKGHNHALRPYGGHMTPSVKDGSVYCLGSAGRAYRLDALTGQVIWDIGLGPWADAWARYKADCMAEGILPSVYLPKHYVGEKVPKAELPHKDILNLGGSLNSTTFNGCPAVAAGVVAYGDPGGALIGVDAETGETLWRKGGLCRNPTAPLAWRHDGEEYFIALGRGIGCVVPRTGEVLWQQGGVSGGHCPAIWGDYLIAPAEGKEVSERCFKLSPEGATQLWELPRGASGGHSSPMIYRDHAWIYCRACSAFPKGDRARTVDVPNYRQGISVVNPFALVVELESGRIVSHLEHVPGRFAGSFTAADGRMATHGAQAGRGNTIEHGLHLYDMDVQAPQHLGHLPTSYSYCTTPILVDGIMYYKDVDRLVCAIDLREEKRPLQPIANGDGFERYVLDVPGFARDGQALTLHLGGRGGEFPQAWAHLAKAPVVPHPAWGDGLTLADGKISGGYRVYLDGEMFEPTLELTLADGKLAGTCRDAFAGYPVAGAATGTLSAVVTDAGSFSLVVRREWNGGSHRGAEGGLTFDLVDGKVANAKLHPYSGGQPDAWSAEIHSHTLAYADRTLTGTIDVTVTPGTANYMPKARYTVEVSARNSCNRLTGAVRVTSGPTKGRSFGATGKAQAAAAAVASPENGLYALTLADGLCRPGGGSRADLQLWLLCRDGAFVDGYGQGVKYSRSTFVPDVTQLRVADGRVTGTIAVLVTSDQYVPRYDAPTKYEVDLAIDGRELKGTHTGVFGIREPKEIAVTGRRVP